MDDLQPFLQATQQVHSLEMRKADFFQTGEPHAMIRPPPITSSDNQDALSSPLCHENCITLSIPSSLACSYFAEIQSIYHKYVQLSTRIVHTDIVDDPSTSSVACPVSAQYLPMCFCLHVSEPEATFSTCLPEMQPSASLNLPTNHSKTCISKVFRPWESETK